MENFLTKLLSENAKNYPLISYGWFYLSKAVIKDL